MLLKKASIEGMKKILSNFVIKFNIKKRGDIFHIGVVEDEIIRSKCIK